MSCSHLFDLGYPNLVTTDEGFSGLKRPFRWTPLAKRRKLVATNRKKSVNPDADLNQEEACHFIGYVPSRGEVWGLDGSKPRPVEVVRLSSPSGSGTTDHRS